MKLFTITQRVVVNTTILVQAKDKEAAEEAASKHTEGSLGFFPAVLTDKAHVSEIETTGSWETKG